ncbi:MAG: hypothetical protein HYU36_20470 [Planctomycetes bacterium]|nr:hypothetical protein [Planctomycetota bacterium]
MPSGEGEKKTIIEGAKEGQAGTRVSDLTAGLRLLLWTNKAEYRVGEPIHVDFRVYNTGRRPVNVYAEFDREGWLVFLEMRKKDGNQEPVYQSTPAQVATRRPRDSLYMALPPGGTVGRFYTLLGTPGKPFPAGEYEIQAGYTNTYETCLASLYFHDEDIRALGRRAYVRLWTGQLVSAPVPIRVKGKMPKGTEKGEKEEKGERGLFRKR